MPGYSIFEGTIADMTWPQVEAAAKRGALMLVPVAVIEQHGPHLPLATDTYGAYLLCRLVREELARSGREAVVAPPYYYGLNPSTGMFPGSINVTKETMVGLLTELLLEYGRFGFSRQFVISHHGDPTHTGAVAEAIAAVWDQGVEAILALGGFVGELVEQVYTSAAGGPLPLPDAAILRARESEATRSARERLTKSSLCVHAEETETSMIMRWFPETLDTAVAILQLEPILPSADQLAAAIQGGRWREVSPAGYIGDPSVATPDNGELYAFYAADIARAIAGLPSTDRGR